MTSTFPNPPKDSLLNLYVKSRSIIETPISFDTIAAMCATGAILKRSCWIDQIKWKIYPNLSAIFIGGSGIGKDTAINGAKELLQEVGGVPFIGGKTPETINAALYALGDPAAGIIFAGELSEFFGAADYQKNMLTEITDLLSTNAFKDISLKSSGTQIIQRPTVSMLGGSTISWLHKAMPGTTMSGGFYPRFLLIQEYKPKISVGLVKWEVPQAVRDESTKVTQEFVSALRDIQAKAKSIGELEFNQESADAYKEYYDSRTTFFSPIADAYAHRSRDSSLKLCMISAVLRGHAIIDSEDVKFVTDILKFIGSRVDRVLAPAHEYLEVWDGMLKMLPSTKENIFRVLRRKHTPFQLERGFQLLCESKEIFKNGDGLYYATEGL